MSASPLTNFTWSFLVGDESTKKSPIPFDEASSFRVRSVCNSTRAFSMRLSRSPVTPRAARRARASTLGDCPVKREDVVADGFVLVAALLGNFAEVLS